MTKERFDLITKINILRNVFESKVKDRNVPKSKRTEFYVLYMWMVKILEDQDVITDEVLSSIVKCYDLFIDVDF